MTIVVVNNEPHGDLRGYIRRLETLVDHLKKLSEGRFPTNEELRQVPLLDRYQPAVRPADCLEGYVEGHPTLTGAMTTSELWSFAPELGWARSTSRLFRLGRPAGTSDRLQ